MPEPTPSPTPITYQPFYALKNLLAIDVPDPLGGERTGDYILGYRLREVSQDMPKIAIVYNGLQIDKYGGGMFKYNKTTNEEEWLNWGRMQFFIEALDEIEYNENTVPDWSGATAPLRNTRFLMWFLDRAYQSLVRNRDRFKRDYGLYVNVGQASDIYTAAENLIGVRIPLTIDFPVNSIVQVSPSDTIQVIEINQTYQLTPG